MEKGGPASGGDHLRERVREILRGESLALTGPEPVVPLQFVLTGVINALGEALATQIDPQ